jgi:two-component system sensor histidine kinase MprB
MTFRRRIALAAASAVALAVIAASAVIYVTTRHQLRAQVDDGLRARVPDVQFAPADAAGVFHKRFSAPAPGPDRTGRLIISNDPLGGAAGFAVVTTPRGEVLRTTGAPPLPADKRLADVAAGTAGPFFRDATIDGTHVRVYTARGPLGDLVQVARPLTDVDASLTRMRWILLLVGVGGVGLAAGFGLVVSRTALAPVARLTDTAEHVAATQDLSRRLPEQEADELGRLAASFNTMLSALQASRDAQHQLVADASHELRTPLTSVRTNLETLARAPDLPAAEREHVVAVSAVQLEELSVLVGDLVDLARPSEDVHEAEDVRLDLLVDEAVARARRHAPGCSFVIDADATTVHGEPWRLRRAVANLLDNAVKHGPAAGPVEVEVRDGAVVVRDHGPGFADEDLPHVFDRFYRAAGARGLPGSGLGLAIVRQVAETHDGVVLAANADGGGARLVFSLPAVRSLTPS